MFLPERRLGPLEIDSLEYFFLTGFTMPRPNWFLAFPIDGSFLASVPAPPPGFRLFPPEDVHLTLVFLGGCGEAVAERAFQAFDELLSNAPRGAIPVSLGEVVPMGGSRRDYTALSALLARGRAETVAFTLALRDGITDAAGLRRQARPPKPHVTLGRPKRSGKEEHRQAGLGWAAGLELGGVERTLDRVALYTWAEPRRERLFRIVAERSVK
jgi:RNA 2',3'-cyclic 3'-phosphodiesterase